MEIGELQLQNMLVEFWMKGFKCSEEGHDASEKTLDSVRRAAKLQALDKIDEIYGE